MTNWKRVDRLERRVNGSGADDDWLQALVFRQDDGLLRLGTGHVLTAEQYCALYPDRPFLLLPDVDTVL